MVADVDPAKVEALGGFGAAFGSCFQIIDDVLDYGANERELGKKVGDDFREGKVTLPVIYAYHQGSAQEKQFWEHSFSSDDLGHKDFTQAQAYLSKHHALDHARHKAQTYATQAKESLHIFQESSLKTALLDLVDFSLQRGY